MNQMKKFFLITVDTEGDNLWKWHDGQPITTENTLFVPRFQELCEDFGFIPVYLTNHEMALDKRWVSFARRKAMENKCEIGMHLHAWNTPPEYPLERRYKGNPYITEYPDDIIEQKVITLHNLLENQFEVPVISHRAGRWATNSSYFKILVKHGIKIDCSVTPGLDLSGINGCSKNCGNDYRNTPYSVYEIVPGLFEVPMSTASIHRIAKGTFRHKVKTLLKGDALWLRPIMSMEDLKLLTSYIETKKAPGYLEFMIHSSELMPGCNPYFKDKDAVEMLFMRLKQYFELLSAKNYVGTKLGDFVDAIS